jgi:hypothetical protein
MLSLLLISVAATLIVGGYLAAMAGAYDSTLLLDVCQKPKFSYFEQHCFISWK